VGRDADHALLDPVGGRDESVLPYLDLVAGNHRHLPDAAVSSLGYLQ
jgi:hypothetical protein